MTEVNPEVQARALQNRDKCMPVELQNGMGFDHWALSAYMRKGDIAEVSFLVENLDTLPYPDHMEYRGPEYAPNKKWKELSNQTSNAVYHKIDAKSRMLFAAIDRPEINTSKEYRDVVYQACLRNDELRAGYDYGADVAPRSGHMGCLLASVKDSAFVLDGMKGFAEKYPDKLDAVASVYCGAVQNPNVSPEVIKEALAMANSGKMTEEQRAEICFDFAKNPKTPPAVMKEVLDMTNSGKMPERHRTEVLCALADNPKTPPAVMSGVVQSTCNMEAENVDRIAGTFSENPNLPLDVAKAVVAWDYNAHLGTHKGCFAASIAKKSKDSGVLAWCMKSAVLTMKHCLKENYGFHYRTFKNLYENPNLHPVQRSVLKKKINSADTGKMEDYWGRQMKDLQKRVRDDDAKAAQQTATKQNPALSQAMLRNNGGR